MLPDGITPEKRLDVLHDHYKETFSRIRETEASRNRLLIWVIVAFGVLAVEVAYPAEFDGSFESLSVIGTQVALGGLPRAVLLSATWVLATTLALRYCQTSITVERQYPYLHRLEDEISPMLGGFPFYCREGKFYLEEYPPLLNVVFFGYVVLLPAVIIGASIAMVYQEWAKLDLPILHRLVDTVLAISVIVLFALYRVQPKVAGWLHDRRERIKSDKKKDGEDSVNTMGPSSIATG